MLVEVEPGVSIYAQDVGEGPPVVLIAGFGMSHAVWDGEVTALAEAGHRVVCVDLRGTGDSDKPWHGYSMERISADVTTVLAHLGVSAATFVGWSFGGQISFNLAATTEGLVSRLVLLASHAIRSSRSDRFPFGEPAEELLPRMQGLERRRRLSARARILAGAFAEPPDALTTQFVMNIWMQMPSWSAIASYETYMTADLYDLIPRVRVPVLQLVGAADPLHPPEEQRWLAERLVDSRVQEIPGGHFPMFEAPEELRRALVEFAAGS